MSGVFDQGSLEVHGVYNDSIKQFLSLITVRLRRSTDSQKVSCRWTEDSYLRQLAQQLYLMVLSSALIFVYGWHEQEQEQNGAQSHEFIHLVVPI